VEVKDFLVNANIFVRWYNNTPLFVGSIIGAAALIMAVIAFIVFGKKKKK
jgi:LPXTG-motif cell wall-anchored protein